MCVFCAFQGESDEEKICGNIPFVRGDDGGEQLLVFILDYGRE